MTATPSPDVLVVGAGPVGLTLAAALAHRGLRCRIVDKAAEPTSTSKALVVWCRSLELLAHLGLADTFVRNGLVLKGGTMHAEGKPILHLNLQSDASEYGFALMIPQSETERLLTEHLQRAGVRVEREVELTGFSEDDDGVRCSLRGPGSMQETLQVPWLAGCDGAHSTVRHTLGMEFDGHAEPNDWMLADGHMEGPVAGDQVSIYWTSAGVLALFPMGGGRFRIIADLGTAGEARRPDPTLEEAQALLRERGPAGARLRDALWLSNFRIHERKVSEYRRGRVMLAGDAAHIHSPAGGQGMNTGMQDAFNLAWKLELAHRGRGRTEELLDSYSLERSAVGDLVLSNAERFTRLATLRSPVAQWLRNHLVPLVGSLRAVQSHVRDEWFELSINYRESPLSSDAWSGMGGSARAGDRMPDAALMSPATQERTTLHRLLCDTRHTLLVLCEGDDASEVRHAHQAARDVTQAFPADVAAHVVLSGRTAAHVERSGAAVAGGASAAAEWLDVDGKVADALGADSGMVTVIRPDGYIAYRGMASDVGELNAHLTRWLVPAR